MATKRVNIISILVVFLLLINAVSCQSNPSVPENKGGLDVRKTYVFPSDTSLAFFGVAPNDFMSTYFAWYDNCEDFRTCAEINEDGDLVLRLTKEQEDAFLQFHDSGLEDFKQIPGVEISDDYSSVTIKGTEEEVKNIVWNQYPLFLVFDMANRQLFSGKDPKTITITVTLINSTTEKIVYTATWPKEAISFKTENLNFDS